MAGYALQNLMESFLDFKPLTPQLGAIAVPTIILGMLLAILVNVQFRFIVVMRTLYFVPAVVSFAASAVLWTWIYRPAFCPRTSPPPT